METMLTGTFTTEVVPSDVPVLSNGTTNETLFIYCGGNATETPEEYYVSYVVIPILLISCLVSMLVNVIVIASACWIRCSMTPNLKISLSLAAADACSSSLYGLLIFIDVYVPIQMGVFLNVVEILRLSGIVITVVHLMALAVNHYIGILKPLHYNSIVTSKKVAAVIWLLWICPTVTIICMCLGFDNDNSLLNSFIYNLDDVPSFMQTFDFRITFSSLFFVPILIMVVCYTHILVVVKQQQSRWNNLSRIGSTRIKGKPSQKISRERKQLEGNVRAIYTTLLILGSCFIGWAPALLFYTLACTAGCYIEGEELVAVNCNHKTLIMIVRLLDNILVILKMLANPVIYSIRMKEIRDGTQRMFQAICGLFCRSRHNGLDASGYYYRTRLHNSSASQSTIQVRMASAKNGNATGIAKEIENTFL
ncbi:hypothetical protein GWI33_004181 [Rhynchophorus ferrugineus]|uniref:G-protein coupled receptors family 1 profile domain-containing protein n=1 Tax=Rhynchophorus ferrugineus TaxID=354439 RepID=A0A834IIX8_RHYFE|nr:hypothetical protein GWI33_004181 [Rhynchophorus ferrugineus]